MHPSEPPSGTCHVEAIPGSRTLGGLQPPIQGSELTGEAQALLAIRGQVDLDRGPAARCREDLHRAVEVGDGVAQQLQADVPLGT